MPRRIPLFIALATGSLLVVTGCAASSPSTGPVLTDPTEIVQAALDASRGSSSVHLDLSADGTLTVSLPIAGTTGPGTPIDLTGTTAAADIDLAGTDARATFAVPQLLGLAGEVIALDGKAYIKTSLTGPLYRETAASASPVDPSAASGAFDAIGSMLLEQGVDLVKGDDIACGSTQCYTVTTTLDAADIGQAATAFAGMVDLTGATIELTLRVEQTGSNHPAGLTAVLTTADGKTVTIDVTASKWDENVTISPPAPEQVAPATGG